MSAGLVSQMQRPPAATDEALIAQFRDWAGGYASALRAWPALREAALALGVDAGAGLGPA
jgi:hypothetical protein